MAERGSAPDRRLVLSPNRTPQNPYCSHSATPPRPPQTARFRLAVRAPAVALLAIAGAIAGTVPASAAPSAAVSPAAAGAPAAAGQRATLDAIVSGSPASATPSVSGGASGGGQARHPATPRQIARKMLRHFHWSARRQFRSLSKLWARESGWNVHASNPYSGAYGIPQAVPGFKMSSAGRHWRTSARTQIRWGMRYIRDRYGSPRRAWRHETSVGWY
jgi:hypothetical protein